MSKESQNIENQRIALSDANMTTEKKFDHLQKVFDDAGCHPSLSFEYAVKVAGICKATNKSVLDVSIKKSKDKTTDDIQIGRTDGDRIIITKTPTVRWKIEK